MEFGAKFATRINQATATSNDLSRANLFTANMLTMLLLAHEAQKIAQVVTSFTYRRIATA
jgi:hypothetical protein